MESKRKYEATMLVRIKCPIAGCFVADGEHGPGPAQAAEGELAAQLATALRPFGEVVDVYPEVVEERA